MASATKRPKIQPKPILDVESAPKYKNDRTALERVEKFISDTYFTDENLFGKLYASRSSKAGSVLPALVISHLQATGARQFDEVKQRFADAQGRPFPVGSSIGPTWTTHWFWVQCTIPSSVQAECSDATARRRLHLLWNCECEAMVYAAGGQCVQGLSGEFGRVQLDLTDHWAAVAEAPETVTDSQHVKVSLYIECACNLMFGAGEGGQIQPPNHDKQFTLKQAELAVLRDDVRDVLVDLQVLHQLSSGLSAEPLRHQALFTANHCVNLLCYRPHDPVQLAQAHTVATEFFGAVPLNYKGLGNERQAKGAFTMHAVGNCHIDTAWLWPYSETRRKCARSWLNTLQLMRKYDNLTFAVSQAVQLDWLRTDYPDIFGQIVQQVRGSQARWSVVGGSWVEMDGNLPSGEAFVRQMLYGQQFFQKHFDRKCDIFWLPDTFGYSAQLPQIITLSGMRYFLTQKLSWNLVNTFPHNTFHWRGIDGTPLLSHFPPGGNYCREVTVSDCVEQRSKCLDAGRCDKALFLYGYGDGGGGPDEQMCQRLDRLSRMAADNGSTLGQLVPSTPERFFQEVERSDAGRLCSWSGELYLELHQGTFTTQAGIKRHNRNAQLLLALADFVCVLRALLPGSKMGMQAPANDLTAEWQCVLLNQFHDVLPGTSIGKVNDEVQQLYGSTYRHILHKCTGLDTLTEADVFSPNATTNSHYYVNRLGWPRVVRLPASDDQQQAVYARLPATSITEIASADECPAAMEVKPSFSTVTVMKREDRTLITIGNQYLMAVIRQNGQIISLNDLIDIRQDKCCNTFVLYHDVPLYWDAWDMMDYHGETALTIDDVVHPLSVVHHNQLCVELSVSLRISSTSRIEQRIVLNAHEPFLRFHTTVDWHEAHRLLKWQQHTNINCDAAQYEIQFGYLHRPTHANTSWDSARYEVCAQKYAVLAEHARGLAVINRDKHGHSATSVSLSLSLLRAPTAPDANADQGTHHIHTALMPFRGQFDGCVDSKGARNGTSVVRAAYEFNDEPLLTALPVLPGLDLAGDCWLLRALSDNHGIALEHVKISERKDGVVLRFYESLGSACSGSFELNALLLPAASCVVAECNLLEECQPASQTVTTSSVLPGKPLTLTVRCRKFQIVSVYVKVTRDSL